MKHVDWPANSLGSSADPSVVLVAGAPGSGKSTVGALIAGHLSAALLDLDTATASLTAVVGELLGTDDLDDPEVVRATRGARYEAITALAEDNVAVGLSAVLVAPFSTERRDPAAWNAIRHRMSEVGARTTLVWLRISPDEVLRRVESRAADRDGSKRRGDWLAGLDLGPPAVPHIEVDAHLPPAAIAELVVASPVGERQG
ncbi:MAG: AAA family ATPase [Marmoricola sp.]